MSNILPFEPRPGRDVTVHDVDGDGVPDRIIPGHGTDDGMAPTGRPTQVRATVAVRDTDLRPVVPGWLRTADGRRAVLGRWVTITRHRILYHAVRSPWYVPLLAWRTVRGLVVVITWLARWVVDARADALEQQLATGAKSDVELFIRHREARADRIRARLTVLVAGTVAIAGAGWCTWRWLPGWVPGTAAVAAFVGLVRAGTPAGRPVLSAAMLASPGYRELTDRVVMRSLRAAGLGGQAARFDKDGNELTEDTRPTLAAPIARSSNGRGYEVLVDLPYGKTAGDAAAAVDRIASGLDVDVAQVFPEPVPGSTRRCRLYVADEDPMLLPSHPSPLGRLPKVSVWDPHPLAQTPAGRTVSATLLFSSFLIGSVPRAGKSYAAKALVAPGVLDPHCDMTAIDLKGGRDWLATAQVATNYSVGDDEDDLLRAVAILEALRDEARARLSAFRRLATVDCPEDKLTREMAAQGARPHLIVVDEVQNLLACRDKDIKKAGLSVLVWLAKTAPAAGFSLIAITQRPAADVIPADLRDITTVRIALRTKTRQASDAILGSDISATGFRTDRFLEHHKGACVIGGIATGTGGDLQVARTDLLTPGQFERACAVGRQRRIDAGTLRGAAAGDEQTTVTVTSVVTDVGAVWPGDESKVQAHALLSRLREVYGARYAALDEAGLTRALKAYGVPVMQVFRDGTNRNGYALADLGKARRAIEAD